MALLPLDDAVTVHEGVSDHLPTLGRDRTTNPVTLHLMSHPFEQMAACAGLVFLADLPEASRTRILRTNAQRLYALDT